MTFVVAQQHRQSFIRHDLLIEADPLRLHKQIYIYHAKRPIVYDGCSLYKTMIAWSEVEIVGRVLIDRGIHESTNDAWRIARRAAQDYVQVVLAARILKLKTAARVE